MSHGDEDDIPDSTGPKFTRGEMDQNLLNAYQRSADENPGDVRYAAGEVTSILGLRL